MLVVNGVAFYRLMIVLERVRNAAKHNSSGDPDNYLFSQEEPSSGLQSKLLSEINDLKKVLETLGAHLTIKSADRLIERLKNKQCTVKQFELAAYEIDSRIRDELSLTLLFSAKPENAKYYDTLEPLFGKEVDYRFPTAAPEIDEAGKCLALGRSTACVMHLMRALEVGLKALADDLGVPFAENWNHLLAQIERVIPTIEAKTHGAKNEQWYSEVATHFRFLKNAWRNHAMHVHERYDDEKAKAIFDSVRAFMQHLSTKLADDSGKLIG